MISLPKQTLSELCQSAAMKFKNRTAFEMYHDECTYNRVTYRELGKMTRQFASLLVLLGVRPADRVMIIAENRPEWAIAYFGVAQAGAVSVPALIDFSCEQLKTIISHAGPSAICGTEKTMSKIAEALGGAASPGMLAAIPVIYLDSIENMGKDTYMREPGASLLVSIRGNVKRLFLDDRDRYRDCFPDTKEDGLATIVYTSGTLGDSKGVMLSNRNLLWTAQAACKKMKIYPRDRCLSVIPLAHTYECTMGLISAILNGASTVYLDRSPSPSVLMGATQALKPTVMLVVPLFIEKIYYSRIAPRLFKSFLYRFPLTRRMAILLAGRKLLSFFGGGLRFLGVGGAPIAEEVERFLWKARFPYAPGYGLTEASPLVAGAAPYRFLFRSVGKPLAGMDVRLAPIDEIQQEAFDESASACGEIQVRGPNVMLGYYRNERKTREALAEDGWLKTGDLGYFDRKGYLYIRGRIKNMILSSSGENIYPEEIETLLGRSPLVEDALVRLRKNRELIAFIFPAAFVRSETANAKLPPESLAEKLEEFRRYLNRQLASFSRIDRIEILRKPFERTPTGKIKRFLYT
ncbi:MAG: AMP-binding protein [Treponema sp.]|jgi:long-chain acyl-CoA synthetase|nr:AMP-binding protein [Treponema sp.]